MSPLPVRLSRGFVPAARRRRALGAVAATCAMLMSLVVIASWANASVPPPPSGWSLVWSDDFVGSAGSAPSGSNWLYDTGTCYPGCPAANWGTGEIETMTSSTNNVFLDGNGNLAIRPVNSGGAWTSGRIETQRTDFQPPAGGVMRVEGRLQQPNVTTSDGLGYWPAFWMLGAPFRGVYTNWPGVGEIDIMEDINGRSSEFGTLHCGSAPGGPCQENSGLGSGERACGGCQTSFHTYAVEYDRSVSPEQIRWYLDGSNFFTVNANQVDATTWNNATHHGFFIILDVAIGGGFPAAFGGGPTSATVSGQSMLVDYVAVYTRGGTTTTPPTSPPGAGAVDAYGTVEAERFNAASGVATESCSDTGGGQDIGNLANGDWARYDNVDFGSSTARQFVGRVASGAEGGVSGLVEVRLDSPSSAPLGSFAIANTGGWQSWRTVPANIAAVTGVHTVYLTFTSGQPADYVNVNWFTFGH